MFVNLPGWLLNGGGAPVWSATNSGPLLSWILALGLFAATIVAIVFESRSRRRRRRGKIGIRWGRLSGQRRLLVPVERNAARCP